MAYSCAICEEEILTSNPKNYFCRKCWGEWNDAIVGKAPWVTYCINEEHQQRRQALRDAGLIHLGDEFDIGEFDGEYRLVPTGRLHNDRRALERDRAT